jgi:serine/alanine adding enzyme
LLAAVNTLGSTDRKTEIAICSAEGRSEWDAFVQHFSRATFCHAYQWWSIIQDTYGHRPIYLIARCGRRLQGVLPLFLVKSRVFGRSLSSMPFLDYGGPCADSPEVAAKLLNHAVGLLKDLGANYIEMRGCDPSGANSIARLDKVTMILDLSSGVDRLWNFLQAKVRNQVRKAEKSGLRVAFGGAELLEEFYPVFAVNMRDLGSPVHHFSFFSNMLAQFGQQAELAIIRDGNRPVGGLVSLFFRDAVVIPWASSLREDFSKCPNNLLYWEAIKHAVERGCKRFDFGRSSINSGTYHFKKQWGARPVQIYWQTLTRTGEPRRASSNADSRYQLATTVWKRLPVALTTFIGPRLRKYITN